MKNQMNLVRGFQPNKLSRLGNIHGGGGGGGEPDDYKFVVEYPDSRVLRVFSRSLLLALAIFSFPWIGYLILGSSNVVYSVVVSEPIDDALLPILIKDLSHAGLLNSGDKALFFSNGGDDDYVEASFKENLRFLNDNEMDLISEYDFERQSSVPDNTFDFILVSGFGAVKFIDRTLKTGGIVVVQLSDNNNPSSMNTFQKPINYKIEYVRRFKSTIVGLRKTSRSFLSRRKSQTRLGRRLFGFEFDSKAKKEEALKGLEDVVLEPPPPRAASSSLASSYKYLPDLMGDSLEGYPRRVYIDVGSSSSIEWFKKNYPTRKREFEMYKIDEIENGKGGEKQVVVGMSDWLKKNVKEEEFVVMKAEVEVVEEMMKNKAISLVDELFLECRHQWQGENNNMSKRAYWECLALYGRLRDEGVAVHQWWSS